MITSNGAPYLLLSVSCEMKGPTGALRRGDQEPTGPVRPGAAA